MFPTGVAWFSRGWWHVWCARNADGRREKEIPSDIVWRAMLPIPYRLKDTRQWSVGVASGRVLAHRPCASGSRRYRAILRAGQRRSSCSPTSALRGVAWSWLATEWGRRTSQCPMVSICCSWRLRILSLFFISNKDTIIKDKSQFIFCLSVINSQFIAFKLIVYWL